MGCLSYMVTRVYVMGCLSYMVTRVYVMGYFRYMVTRGVCDGMGANCEQFTDLQNAIKV